MSFFILSVIVSTVENDMYPIQKTGTRVQDGFGASYPLSASGLFCKIFSSKPHYNIEAPTLNGFCDRSVKVLVPRSDGDNILSVDECLRAADGSSSGLLGLQGSWTSVS